MALTTAATNNKVIKFRKDVQREWVRGNLFAPYMGDGPNSIIRSIRDLMGRGGGEQVNVPLVSKLRGKGVGVGTLVGNEEVIDNAGFRIWIDWFRHAVVTNKAELQKSSIDIMDFAAPMLQDWGKERIRNDIIDALFSIPSRAQPAGLGTQYGQTINGILFDASTSTQRNTWQTDNADRFMFGGTQGNMVAGNFAASCANITTGMTFSVSMILKMKRMAMKASPSIRPYMIKDTNREYYVFFVGPNAFRDLQADPAMDGANKQTRPREGDGMEKNPLFQDGDLLYSGCIIRQIPELDGRLPNFYLTAGAGGTQISPVFMCGQSALVQAWGQMVRKTNRKEDDYDFLEGIGVEAAMGVAKIAKDTPAGNLKEWGLATGFLSSQNDQ